MRRSELAAPSINAALVRPISPGGNYSAAKASGLLVQWLDDLYLLTNWHVATGRRWMTSEERSLWTSEHPGSIAWASNKDSYAPSALDVSIPLSGGLYSLAQIELDDLADPPNRVDLGGPDGGDLPHSYAWDDPTDIFPMGVEQPGRDCVCLHLAPSVRHWQNIISGIAGEEVRLGYEVSEIGIDHNPRVSDRVFVVGYPRSIGSDHSLPPVWTGGSIATEPDRSWKGPRFLIDARTREGQSGSAVIAYAPANGGLPDRHQVLGIYSGRIDAEADIGSVWLLDDLIKRLVEGTDRPRSRRLSPGTEDRGVLKDLDLSGSREP